MEDGIYTPRCNQCWKLLSKRGYKLSCFHLLCSSCCREASETATCPACDLRLNEEIVEISFSRTIEVTKEHDLISAIYSNPLRWQSVMNDAQRLMTVQLYQESMREKYRFEHQERSAAVDCEKQRNSIKQQRSEIERLQKKCRGMDDRMFDMTHRIAEKSRQIEALERILQKERRARSALPGRFLRRSLPHASPLQDQIGIENVRPSSLTAPFENDTLPFENENATTTKRRDATVRNNPQPFVRLGGEAAHDGASRRSHLRVSRPKTPGLVAMLEEQKRIMESMIEERKS